MIQSAAGHLMSAMFHSVTVQLDLLMQYSVVVDLLVVVIVNYVCILVCDEIFCVILCVEKTERTRCWQITCKFPS